MVRTNIFKHAEINKDPQFITPSIRNQVCNKPETEGELVINYFVETCDSNA